MHQIYHFAVIGAGPAGIATVGKLIDHGVLPDNILWIDPEFKVGDFGTKWRNVSSNTRVKLFLKFYHACASFQFSSAPKDFEILNINPDETCQLSLAAQPLQWITEILKNSVHTIQDKISHLDFIDNQWELTLSNQKIRANNVVLAHGAEPKSLFYPEVNEIPLEIALDTEKLISACQQKDVIAVFGSSHSAIMIVRTLLEECKIQKVINFYRQPLRYAVYYEDWILYDDTGLKGKTAEWAKKHIDTIPPEKLQRVLSDQENIQLILPECDHAIYATGFSTRKISVKDAHSLEYNKKTGEIEKGLYGVGIAFPEAQHDRNGTLEHRVGLWKFMDYLDRVVPGWLKPY